jgi:hypothetical protein
MSFILFEFNKQTLRLWVVVLALVLSISVYAQNPSKWIEVKGGKWKPEATTLSEIETVLKPAIIAASKNRGHMQDWGKYTFQYQGRSPLPGQRYVFVNAFCDEPKNHPDLQNIWVEVMDGGACFFSAKYEPESKRLYDISVNGVA